MVVLDKDDVVKGTVTHAKEDIPKGTFTLKQNVDVTEDDDVSIVGNYTSEEGTVEQAVFTGRIKDVDLQEIQKIQVISKAEEIDVIKPNGDYSGYTETILGNLIVDYCNEVSVSKTESTLNLRPSTPDVSGTWVDSSGNNNGIMWDDLIEDVPDMSRLIEASQEILVLNLDNHSLSADYHYAIYQIDLKVYGRAPTSSITFQMAIKIKGVWSDWQNVTLNNTWAWRTATITGIVISEDDINDLQYRMRSLGGTTQFQVDTVHVILYYRYFPNLTKGTYNSTQTYAGEKTLRQIFNWGKLQELFTWYLKPDLEFYFNDGAVDSGVNIALSDNLKKVKGKKQIKKFDKIILLGGK